MGCILEGEPGVHAEAEHLVLRRDSLLVRPEPISDLHGLLVGSRRPHSSLSIHRRRFIRADKPGPRQLAKSVGEYTSIKDALAAVMARTATLQHVESVPLRSAFGRVLAEDFLAPKDVPDSDLSHMDGFAVSSRDIATASDSAPATLMVVGLVPPGHHPKRKLKSGETLQISTGGVLPRGADTVVPVEEVESKGKSILVRRPQRPRAFVFRRGEDMRKGEVLLASGHTLRAQDVGLLTAMGSTNVRVWKKPRVSIIATGSELTASIHPKEGKVRDSHSPVFMLLCSELGCEVVDLGIVEDDHLALKRKLRKGLSSSDLVLTLGGTSVGRKDLVVDTVSRLNPDVLVHGVRMDRGRVAGAAFVEGKPVVMLPGPIQGAMNAFLLLAVPVIERLSHRTGSRAGAKCALAEAWVSRRRFQHFQKVVYISLESGGSVARPLHAETESFRVLTKADGYFVVPEKTTELEAGSDVDVKFLPGFSSFW